MHRGRSLSSELQYSTVVFLGAVGDRVLPSDSMKGPFKRLIGLEFFSVTSVIASNQQSQRKALGVRDEIYYPNNELLPSVCVIYSNQ